MVQCWEFDNQLMPIGFIIDIKELRKSDFLKIDIPTRISEGIYPKLVVQSNEGKWRTEFVAPSVDDFPPKVLTRFEFFKEKEKGATRVNDW